VTSKFTELAIDCADPGGLARFWCSVLDYEVQGEGDGTVTIGSPLVPEGRNHPGPVPPTLTFAHVPDRGAGRRAVVADEAGRPDQEPGVPGALLDDPCRT
jgi:hypothetical protein